MKVSKRYMSKNIPSLKNLDMGFAIRKATANIIDRLQNPFMEDLFNSDSGLAESNMLGVLEKIDFGWLVGKMFG